MKKLLLALFTTLCVATSAMAQPAQPNITLGTYLQTLQLPSFPLNGAEQLYILQGGVDHKILVSQLTGALSGLSIGSTPVSGATSGQLLYSSGGVLLNQAVGSLAFAGTQITSGTVPAAFLPLATSGALGIVQGDGSTLSISVGGIISCTTATASQIGCVKPDGTVITDVAGLITVAHATSGAFGSIKGDGSTLTLASGVISCTTATTSQLGCVKPDGSTITIAGGVISSSAAAASVTIGTTTVTSGTTTYLLYNNGGTLGNEAVSSLAFAGSQITSGTVVAARLPVGTSGAEGIVQGDGSTLTISAGTISCTTATNSQVGCAKPDGSTITIAGGVLTAVGAVASSIGVGVTTVTTGTGSYLLYNNAGTLGNETIASILTGGSGISISGSTNATITCSAATNAALGCVEPDGTIITVAGGAITVAKASASIFGVVKGDGSTLTLSSGTISCTTATISQIGCVEPDNVTITIAGGVITSVAAAATITVGTTTVTSGTTTQILYNNGGVLGNRAANTIAFTTGTLSLAGNLTTTGAFASTFTMSGAYTYTYPGATSTLAALTVADQTLTGGANVTPNNIGTVTSGTTTIDCGASPLQYLTDGGAFTLAAPSNDGSCVIQITNNGSAGAITFSGFTVNASFVGAPLDTTNTHKFMVSILRANGSSIYNVVPQQ